MNILPFIYQQLLTIIYINYLSKKENEKIESRCIMNDNMGMKWKYENKKKEKRERIQIDMNK